MIISSDNYIEQRCKEKGMTYTQGFKAYVKDAMENMYNEIDNNVSKHIVWDQTNLTRNIREQKLTFLKNKGYKKFHYIVFEIDEQTQKNRLNKRNNELSKENNNKFIPENVLNGMKNTFEFPHDGECEFNDISSCSVVIAA